MNKNCTIFITILILGLFLLSGISTATEVERIFYIEDSVGDDYGPGTYNYPKHEVFEPYEGIFDLQKVEISQGEDYYYFSLQFGNLEDPWEGRFGFSLPLIQIYVDNEPGGEKELLQEGANVRLDPEHKWNKLLKISGWWIRLFTPEDRGEDFISLSEDDIDTDYGVEDCEVYTEDDTIYLEINRDYIGPLELEHIYVLVGSFDPFGYDHFRGVTDSPSSWEFYDPELENVEYAPRVIDLVLPEDMEQAEVLADFDDDYPLISPIMVGTYDVPPSHRIYIPAFILLLFLFLILYYLYKSKLEYKIFG